MTTSSILRLVGKRANNHLASHHQSTILRSFSAAPKGAVVASLSTNNSETDVRAVMAAAVVAATGAAGVMSWRDSEKKRADCTAITAVVGREGFGARCVI